MYKILQKKWFPFKEDKVKILSPVVEFRFNSEKSFVVLKHIISNNLYYPFKISGFDISMSLFSTEVLKINHTNLFFVGVNDDIEIKIEYDLTEINANLIKMLLGNHRNIFAQVIVKYIAEYENESLSFRKTINEPTVFCF